jgi:2'-5' RNA ligase
MAESHRLFFAVWPDEAAVQALHEAASEAHVQCGGRLMRRETLHLTLAFLGEIPAGRWIDATAAAAGIAVAPFTVTLDRVEYWKHNRIVWAGGQSEPLAALASSLQAGLRAVGFQLETRPFVAHMTLLRDARCAAPPALVAPISWPVREFTLVESKLPKAGPKYEIVGRWPLV